MPPQILHHCATIWEYNGCLKKIELKKVPIKHMWTVTFDTDTTGTFMHRL